MIWLVPTVTASTMIAELDFGRKVRCHKGAVEKVGDVGVGGIAPKKMFSGRRINWYFCFVPGKAILWNSSRDLS